MTLLKVTVNIEIKLKLISIQQFYQVSVSIPINIDVYLVKFRKYINRKHFKIIAVRR